MVLIISVCILVLILIASFLICKKKQYKISQPYKKTNLLKLYRSEILIILRNIIFQLFQINEINGRSHLICYLGPHQQRRGRVPWWITWRGDRWVNFFRATKNIESARSINWKNNKRIELEKKVWDYLSFELDKLMGGWEWFAGLLFDFYWDLDLDMSLMILYLWEVVPPCEVEGPLGQGTCAIIHRLADPVVLYCHVETQALKVNDSKYFLTQLVFACTWRLSSR